MTTPRESVKSEMARLRIRHNSCSRIRRVGRIVLYMIVAILASYPHTDAQTAAAPGASAPRPNSQTNQTDTQPDFLDDARLEQKVTLACKQVSFTELCRQLQTAIGVAFSADASVGDDNITLFCHARPVRDILLQAARLFNFTWQRSDDKPAFRYELTQTSIQKAREAQARLLDHLSALALFQDKMEQYRPYIHLNNEQLDALLEKTPPKEQQNIRYFKYDRPSITMYLNLSDSQKQLLLEGKTLSYTTQNDPNGLPSLVKAAIFDKYKDVWAYKTANGGGSTRGTNVVVNGVIIPEGPHVVDAPDAYVTLSLQFKRDKAGKYAYIVSENLRVPSLNFGNAQGQVTSQLLPTRGAAPLDNARANAALAQNAQMRQTVTLAIKPTYTTAISAPPIGIPTPPAITPADYQEAIFKATGTDVIADGFESLASLRYLKTAESTLFEALNANCDRLRLRWNCANGWLQFRNPGYFDLRANQVPNRLLEHWVASRREHGAATLDDIAEMAQWGPKDSEEDSGDARTDMGARTLFAANNAVDAYVAGVYGLREWALTRNENLRPHWQLLAQLSPDLRRLTLTPTGLPFTRIPLQLRPLFIARAVAGLRNTVQPGLPEMVNATLRIQYAPASRPPAVPPSTEPPQTFTANGRTFTVESQLNIPPPDWKVKFIYSFGSKRTGLLRHVVEPNGWGFRDPGEKD